VEFEILVNWWSFDSVEVCPVPIACLEGGQLRDGGREASIWWRDISSLRMAEWFHGNVSLFVVDGKNTQFWTDVWVGDVSFRDRFHRLFELSLLKD